MASDIRQKHSVPPSAKNRFYRIHRPNLNGINSLLRQSRPAIVLVVVLFYVVGFMMLYPLNDHIAGFLVVIPVAVAAWLFSFRAGLLATLLTIPAELLLSKILGLDNSVLRDLPYFLVVVIIGTLVGYLSHITTRLETEIAERKQYESKLIEERNLFRIMVDNLPDSIYAKDAQCRFILCNRAFASSIGALSPAEVVGKLSSAFFESTLAARYDANDLAVLETGQALGPIEEMYKSRDGKSKWISVTRVPLRNPEGEIIGVLNMSSDITHEKLIQAQRLQLSLKQKTIELLERFVSDVSRDVRTPLTLIKTSLYLVTKNADPERRKLHLKNINTATHRLEELLDEFVTMYRLDTSSLSTTSQSFSLNKIIRDLVSEFIPLAEKKHHRVQLQLSDEISALYANELELKRAIQNLFINAINCTEDEGEITIETMQAEKALVIEVRDTGIGISRSDMPYIFDRFYKGDNARGMTSGVAGLGLTIAQKIVIAHGGRIEVSSRQGQGSTFRILLPVSLQQKPESSANEDKNEKSSST